MWRKSRNVTPCAFPLSSFGLSDVGLVRTNNEDVFLSMQELGFFALADGMGGHNAGEVAAQEAVRFVSASIEELFASTEKEWNIFDLSNFSKLCIENANSWVHHLGRKKKNLSGMGTTLCTLLFHEKSLIYGHVGDSRIYRLRDGVLEQLTLDHSLASQLAKQGQLSKEKLQSLPYNNILTRAIGTQTDIEPEIHIAPVIANDIYLTCSDGLTDLVPDEKIGEILKSCENIQVAAKTLIKTANDYGGQDNVTALLVKTEDSRENLSR